MLFMQNLSKFSITRSSLGIFSTVAGQNVSGGGGKLGRAKPRESGGKTSESF